MGLLDYLENEDYSDVITPDEEEVVIGSAVYFTGNNDSSDEGNLIINDEVMTFNNEETGSNSYSEEQFIIIQDFFNNNIEYISDIAFNVEVITAFIVAVGAIKISDFVLKLIKIRKEGDL